MLMLRTKEQCIIYVQCKIIGTALVFIVSISISIAYMVRTVHYVYCTMRPENYKNGVQFLAF